MRSETAPAGTEPWRQLIADMVLWLALVLLFLAFRITLAAGLQNYLLDGNVRAAATALFPSAQNAVLGGTR